MTSFEGISLSCLVIANRVYVNYGGNGGRKSVNYGGRPKSVNYGGRWAKSVIYRFLVYLRNLQIFHLRYYNLSNLHIPLLIKGRISNFD